MWPLFSSPCQKQWAFAITWRPSSVNFSHFNLLLWNPSASVKHGRKHPWKVLSKHCSFCSNPLTNMATIGNSCFWLADFKQSSSLKLLGQMSWNLVGSIYGMSSMKIAHFVPIRYQPWPPQTILISDWLISKKSSSLKPLAKWIETW